jgi:hypothetical protein
LFQEFPQHNKETWMNTANLQLEGLYLAVAAINNSLVERGVLTREDVDISLRRAEQVAIGDDRSDNMSPANRDAMTFAARFLRLANNMLGDGFTQPFSDLAEMIGETKPRYNGQE